jgi:hypothetical protein
VKYKNLHYLEKGKIYGAAGNIIENDIDADSIVRHISTTNSALYTPSLNSSASFPYLKDFVGHRTSKVICTKKGTPALTRVRTNKGTRWIIGVGTWDEDPEPGVCNRMWDVFETMGVGFAPTPASLGTLHMVKIHEQYRLPRHTGLSLSCEKFLKQHQTNGIITTLELGYYPELAYIDKSAAHLSKYWLQPSGTARWERNCSQSVCATYFGRCTVIVASELSLSPFSTRARTGKKRLSYPRTPGVYEDVYLWKEQVEQCKEAGLGVQTHEGYSWPEFTTDNMQWCQSAYWLRQGAGTEALKKKVKSCINAPIGRMGMDRIHYSLVDEAKSKPEDIPIVNEYGEPIDFYIRKEVDRHSAYMTHWWAYTLGMCAVDVFKFALPYAQQGRLVSIDYDSVLVKEISSDQLFIERGTAEAKKCKPGTWLYQKLHEVSVTADRTFRSLELTHTPGVSHNDTEHRQNELSTVA